MRRLLPLLLLLFSGCWYSATFECTEDVQCGTDGRCLGNACGFVDEDCETGYRYGEHTSGGLAGECVGVEAFVDAGVPDAEPIDAAPPDAMLPCGSGSCACLASVVAGGWHTCATTGDDDVFCWGRDFEGQVGDGGACDPASMSPSVGTPALIAGANGAGLVGGALDTCEMIGPSNVRCWGDNARFQAGSCATTDDVCAPATASVMPGGGMSVALGALHGCARGSSQITCWGQNNLGELGIGTVADATACTVPLTPISFGGIPIDLAAGGSTTCTIISNAGQRAFCWGSNLHGECALDPMLTQPGCVGSGGQAGGACGTPREIVGFTDFDEVAVGDGHVCARRTLGEVVCWGDNTEGAVGVGAAGTIFTPTSVTFPGVTPRARLALGNNHSCVITDGSDTGAVYCWGDNTAGQLGGAAIGMASSQTPVQIMKSATETLTGVVSITAGAQHTCAQQTDGTIWCWGDNACGQLGDGNGGACSDPATPAPVPVPLPVNPLLTCP